MWREVERQNCGDRFASSPSFGEVHGTIDMGTILGAALQALRQPSAEIVAAGDRGMSEAAEMNDMDDAAACWTAQIDAILEA